VPNRTATLSDSERYRSIAAAIACIAVFSITTGYAAPLISLILESRDVSRTVIGVMASVPSIAILLTAPLVPRLVAWLGLRRFLSGCIAIEFVLFLLLPVFDNLYAWFVIRALMGASSSGLFIASETWINEVALERTRGRVIAVYGMIISGSFGLGPLLIPLIGIDGLLPFVVGSAFIALAALPLLWTGGLSPSIEGRSKFSILAFLLIAPTVCVAIWVSSFKEMAVGSLLPVYGVRSGLGEGEAAMMLSAAALGAIVLQLPIGWLLDRINRHAVVIACSIGGAVGVALLPIMVETGGPVMWLGLLCWGGVFSGVYTGAMAIIGQRFSGAELVTANAAVGFLWGLGALMGPTTSGIAMDIWDPNGLPGVVFVLTVLLVVVAVCRRLQQRVSPRE